MPKAKIGIIGATGYTGSELVRILTKHPEVEMVSITSESRKGEAFSDVHPFFKGIEDQPLVSVHDIDHNDFDVVFLALPHGVSMDFVKDHMDKGYNIIDLSGDFRLSSAEVYESWYPKPHSYAQGFKQAVYGLPELFREKIKGKKLIANPGCYPTSAILALAPLVKNNLIQKNIISDSKSGVTGAGIKAKNTTHYPNVNDNFKAYGVKTHRHTIEIEESLNAFENDGFTLQFTPHLLPTDRGIVSTTYSTPVSTVSEAEIVALYEGFYADEDFIRLVGQPPALKDVRGTNYCNLYVAYDDRTNNIIVISAIDNLVKGAAGQAVQNMNILMGWPEALGLGLIPLNP